MGGVTTWTADEDSLLLRLRADHLAFDDIARRMGKTKGACIGRANRLNAPRLGRIRSSAFWDMIADGEHWQIAAKRIGMDHDNARRMWSAVVNKYGWQAA